MLFEARQDRCPIKIVLEEINLPLIGQVVAPWIEVIDVDPWQSYIMQVLIEALLRCQFTTIWEVIVELVALPPTLFNISKMSVYAIRSEICGHVMLAFIAAFALEVEA